MEIVHSFQTMPDWELHLFWSAGIWKMQKDILAEKSISSFSFVRYFSIIRPGKWDQWKPQLQLLVLCWRTEANLSAKNSHHTYTFESFD